MAIMVPHPWCRGMQQSADMLRNKSTLLKLEKTILITINLTTVCTMRRRRRCGCRRRCPQLCMGRLRRFRRNRSVLWNYRHRPVARLPRRRRGRQSEQEGRRGAIWGVDNSQFAASMGTIGRGGRIRHSHRHCDALMGVVGEGAQGLWSGVREKVSITLE